MHDLSFWRAVVCCDSGYAPVGMKVFGTNGEAETFADPRIKAVLMLSPTGRGQERTEESWNAMNLPMLVVTGSDDPSRRTGHLPEWRTEPCKFASPGGKYLAFIEGLDGAYGASVRRAADATERLPFHPFLRTRL